MKKKLLTYACAFALLQPFAVVAQPSDDNRDDGPKDDSSIGIEYVKNGVVNRAIVPIDVVYYLMHMAAVQAAIQRKLAEQQEREEAEAADESGQERQQGHQESSDDEARFKPVTDIKTKFSDVGGMQAAKHALAVVVDYLKNPAIFRELGARIPRGVLLCGGPGNGKTLIARALAGEAQVPFFSVTGSEFVELYVGAGAKHIRELFKAARAVAPCIIFFDEFDAVAAKRADGTSGGDREHSQTLNQLLTEMDGFEKDDKPIMVVAATNRIDMLDPAAIRPGRFDQKIEVTSPDMVGRVEILTACLRKIKADPAINVTTIARGTPGFSGAELANLVNEAALHAVARSAATVAMSDFDAAADKVVLGERNETLQQKPKDLEATAYHEAGHALITLLLPKVTDPLYKVTIEARGAALGFAASLPEGDRSSYSKDELLARIMVSLGGRIGEELGVGEQFVGVTSDLKHATKLARDMVCKYGMSDLGLVASSSEKGDKIDAEIRKIVAKCEANTRVLLTENWDKLKKLADELLKEKTLTAEKIYQLLDITPRTINPLGVRS